MACEHCNGTGWMNVRYGPNDERMGVTKCVCRTRRRAEQEKARPGGFLKPNYELSIMNSESKPRPGDWGSEKPTERQQPSDEQIERAAGTVEYAAARAAMLQEPDREIAAIILNHRGKKNAVSIEEICKMLWADEWAGASLELVSEAHRLTTARNNLVRTVKAAVERIRTEARIPVAAHKGSGGGYYIPETAEEVKDCHDRLFGEGIKLIRLSQLFERDTDLVRELEGQLKL